MDSDFSAFLAGKSWRENTWPALLANKRSLWLLSKNRKKVTVVSAFHMTSLSCILCVVLIYCISLLCDYTQEEAPPIRIHQPMFFVRWMSMSYWIHGNVESASSTPEKDKLRIITFFLRLSRHNFLTISYHNPYFNWIFENLYHCIMFGRDN